MKKKAAAFILAVIMLFSLTASPASAACFDAVEEVVTNVFCKGLAFVFESLVKAIAAPLGEGDNIVSEQEYTYDGFCDGLYDGTDEFITEAPSDAKWSLGSAEASLVPENWQNYENLYIGGYMSFDNGFSNDVKEILDDMKVRVIALNDGTDRGTAVFAVIDSIGLGNPDVAIIRQSLADFAKENNINSINIFATHTHSGIDTQGLWTDILGTWPQSFLKGYTGIGDFEGGTNEEYMNFLYGKVASAIESAVSDMEEGTMTYSEKDFGDKYVKNSNRESADSLDTKIKRFIFTPDNESSAPTLILNMSAHPSTVGLATDSDPTKGHGVSADYVYYIGQVVNGAGYDFMFFNGSICGIYINRLDVEESGLRVDIADDYGTEIGQIALAMTMTEEEILNDSYLMSFAFAAEKLEGHSYTPWYENWTPAKETAVKPILNIKLKAVEAEISNPVMILAAKLQLVNYLVKKTADGKYFITSEIGYMEMGDAKIALVPGEFCPDLTYGGSSLTAEGSALGEAFTEHTLTEIFGEDILVFGMANDAIGYIVPDNDYLMCLDFGHYHETISLGRNTASTLMKAFAELKEEIK